MDQINYISADQRTRNFARNIEACMSHFARVGAQVPDWFDVVKSGDETTPYERIRLLIMLMKDVDISNDRTFLNNVLTDL